MNLDKLKALEEVAKHDLSEAVANMRQASLNLIAEDEKLVAECKAFFAKMEAHLHAKADALTTAAKAPDTEGKYDDGRV